MCGRVKSLIPPPPPSGSRVKRGLIESESAAQGKFLFLFFFFLSLTVPFLKGGSERGAKCPATHRRGICADRCLRLMWGLSDNRRGSSSEKHLLNLLEIEPLFPNFCVGVTIFPISKIQQIFVFFCQLVFLISQRFHVWFVKSRPRVSSSQSHRCAVSCVSGTSR